jgi:hypothetical protein
MPSVIGDNILYQDALRFQRCCVEKDVSKRSMEYR